MDEVHYYFDRQGHPIDVLTWADRRSDPKYMIVAEDQADGVVIRTVWVGLRNPLVDSDLFATAVRPVDSPRFRHVMLWPDEDAAMHGHAAVVKAAPALAEWYRGGEGLWGHIVEGFHAR